jgi:hypothetical protein
VGRVGLDSDGSCRGNDRRRGWKWEGSLCELREAGEERYRRGWKREVEDSEV